MEFANKKVNIEITTGSIIKILVVLFLLWIIYLIRDVVAILFLALILVSILEPMVLWLQKKKIPKVIAVLMIYFVLVALLALLIVLLIPPIIDQFNQLLASFPQYWEKIKIDYANFLAALKNYGVLEKIESSWQKMSIQLPTGSEEIFSKVENFISGIVSLFVMLVITFYLLVEENAIKRILRSVLPGRFLPYSYQLFNRIQQKLGLWLRGQLILALIIFILVYFALLVSGVKYALILALIAGFLEFIPYLGPFISGFIAVILTLFQSPILALWVLFIYWLIQFFENHILVPMIMQKTVGLNPVISILSLLIGAKLGGFIGIFLAIPVATALSVFVQDLFDIKKAEEFKLEEE